jgi:3-hydroxyacyl-[acyl-carrier-protein] dehydratase
MSRAPAHTSQVTDAAATTPSAPTASRGVPGRDGGSAGARPTLIDLSTIDLSARLLSRQQIERWNAHRGAMAMIDWIIWYSSDFKLGVALKQVRADEFWVDGHFPGRPMLPGVLMIESGAQLASFLYNIRFPEPKIAAFIRIEEATFRTPVAPGDDLYLLCREVKFTPKRFSSDIQGLVGGKVAFEARITGMAL